MTLGQRGDRHVSVVAQSPLVEKVDVWGLQAAGKKPRDAPFLRLLVLVGKVTVAQLLRALENQLIFLILDGIHERVGKI